MSELRLVRDVEVRETRVMLNKRELDFWIATLTHDRRSRIRVAEELERAVDAAMKAGLFISPDLGDDA